MNEVYKPTEEDIQKGEEQLSYAEKEMSANFEKMIDGMKKLGKKGFLNLSRGFIEDDRRYNIINGEINGQKISAKEIFSHKDVLGNKLRHEERIKVKPIYELTINGNLCDSDEIAKRFWETYEDIAYDTHLEIRLMNEHDISEKMRGPKNEKEKLEKLLF